jgi:hypothetical protein
MSPVTGRSLCNCLLFYVAQPVAIHIACLVPNLPIKSATRRKRNTPPVVNFQANSFAIAFFDLGFRMSIVPSQVNAILGSVLLPAQQEVQLSPGDIVVASPYLTSNVAENILEAATPATVAILTTFKAENFVLGASSLETLRRMITAGFRLYHLDNLHAKVISSPSFCFVGSQNLTLGGEHNREVSVHISEEPAIAEINRGLQAWLQSAQAITVDMIDDMERLIEPLLGSFASLRHSLGGIDQQVGAAELERNHQARLLQEAQNRRDQKALLETVREAHSTLRSAVRSKPTSRAVRLTLQHISPQTWSSWSSHYTLRASPDDDLTTWIIDGETVILTKRQRYLLVAPETGKLGWPALNKTRLTRFGMDLTPSNTDFYLGGLEWRVGKIRFNQQMKTLKDWNVTFTLLQANAACELFMKFTLLGMELQDLKPVSERRMIPQEINSVLSSNATKLSTRLRTILSDSFRYKSNGRGIDARDFCEGLGSHLKLSL